MVAVPVTHSVALLQRLEETLPHVEGVLLGDDDVEVLRLVVMEDDGLLEVVGHAESLGEALVLRLGVLQELEEGVVEGLFDANSVALLQRLGEMVPHVEAVILGDREADGLRVEEGVPLELREMEMQLDTDTDADALRLALSVVLREGVNEGVLLKHAETLALRLLEMVPQVEGVSLGVALVEGQCVAVGQVLPLCVEDSVGETLSVPLRVTLIDGDPQCDVVTVRVPEPHVEALGEDMTLMETVTVRDSDGEVETLMEEDVDLLSHGLVLTDGDCVVERVTVTHAESLGDMDAEIDGEIVVVPLREGDDEADLLRDGDGDVEALRLLLEVTDSVPLTVLLLQAEGDPVPLCDVEKDGVRDGDAVCERLRVAQLDALDDAQVERLREPVVDCVLETETLLERDIVGERLPHGDAVALRDRLTDALELTDDDSLSDVLTDADTEGESDVETVGLREKRIVAVSVVDVVMVGDGVKDARTVMTVGVMHAETETEADVDLLRVSLTVEVVVLLEDAERVLLTVTVTLLLCDTLVDVVLERDAQLLTVRESDPVALAQSERDGEVVGDPDVEPDEHGEAERLLQGEALDVEHSDPVSESLREGEDVAL